MHIFTRSLAFIVLLLDQLSSIAASSDATQMPIQWSEYGDPKAESAKVNTLRVAIIGAGIAGASSAHHLHKFARLHQPLDVTIFEVDDQVGGRIRSAHVFGEPLFDVEVGASAFTEDDWCLNEAMQEVGLRRDVHVPPSDNIGVWDGNNFIMSCNDEDKPLTRTLWQSLKWRWRYGLSLTEIHAMIQGIADRFSSFVISHLLLALPERLRASFTSQESSVFTTPSLGSCRVSAELINEAVRAESRYRHARDPDQVNVRSSPLVLRSAPNIAVYGGNQRLPHRMLKIAEAHIHLNTLVTRIAVGEQRRWAIYAESTKKQAKAQPLTSKTEFDIVILAAPFASTSIYIDPSISASISTSEVRPYLERHITLFSTLQQLSPKYFNQSTNYTVPERILTAPAQFVAEDANDIFSIAVAARFQQLPSDTDDNLEYIYKVISSKPFPNDEIARLLDYTKPIPNDEIARLLDYNLDSSTENKSETRTLDDLGVTWLHRQAWPHAYPQFNPKEPALHSNKIAPDLYYTAAAEQMLSTMEMSCRMGKSVAEHLYDSKWVGELIP